FNTVSRQWNIANNALYIQAIANNEPYWEIEILSTTDVVNEYIMTALRTTEGINLSKVQEILSVDAFNSFLKQVDSSKWNQYFIKKANSISLNDEGKLF